MYKYCVPQVTVTHAVSKSEYFVVEDADLDRAMKELAALKFVPLQSEPKVDGVYLIDYEGMKLV